MEYAQAHEMTLNDVVERLVDQLLLQVAPQKFRVPTWLAVAIAQGHIPLRLPEQRLDDEDGDADGRVVNLRAR